MRRIVSDDVLDILFRAARDGRAWLVQPVSDTILRAVWELVRLCPGSGACGPVRVVFARSEPAKARLAAALPEAHRGALLAAPAVAIIGCPASRDGESDDPKSGMRREAALREGTLLAAYLILAARALGLDCAPIWQFDAALVDAACFPDAPISANFLCALGYGDDSQTSTPVARPGFAEACTIS